MSDRRFTYEVFLLNNTGLTTIPNSAQQKALQSHLERKFPRFTFSQFSTKRMKGSRVPVPTVIMIGELFEKQGEELIRAEVAPFVGRWIQQANAQHRSSR